MRGIVSGGCNLSRGFDGAQADACPSHRVPFLDRSRRRRLARNMERRTSLRRPGRCNPYRRTSPRFARPTTRRNATFDPPGSTARTRPKARVGWHVQSNAMGVASGDSRIITLCVPRPVTSGIYTFFLLPSPSTGEGPGVRVISASIDVRPPSPALLPRGEKGARKPRLPRDFLNEFRSFVTRRFGADTRKPALRPQHNTGPRELSGRPERS